MESALRFADKAGITDFDLTGGAPEMNPDFKWLVRQLAEHGGRVTDRCNLTVVSEPRQEGLPEFLAEMRVNVTASLPHYGSEITDRIRGSSVFQRSISALRMLNGVGYGKPDTGLELTLVHNPSGAILPGHQESLEAEFRRKLLEDHEIVFTHLIAMTNIPAGRFLRFLEESGNLRRYMSRLEQCFNPATTPNLMCRTLISVRWDGELFDCDFNQSLGLQIRNGMPTSIRNASLSKLVGRAVRCRNHCYGCTAGQGSSCGGAVT
jgi:radical SAM/Cys-rich protein